MKVKKLSGLQLVLFTFIAVFCRVNGQETSIYSHIEQKSYDQAFEDNLLIRSFKNHDHLPLLPYNDFHNQIDNEQRKIISLLSLIYIHPEYAAKHISNYLHTSDLAFRKSQMSSVLGKHYYNQRNYPKALQAYEVVNSEYLSNDAFSDFVFCYGYCSFVTKDFKKAASLFKKTIDQRNRYYYPSNYYFGMSRYFEGDFKTAARHFERVSTSEVYKDQIPNYLAQIYFAEGEYKKLISYAEIQLNKPNVQQKDKINQLVGQAYYQNGDYAKALDYLIAYEQGNTTLSEVELFQIAYTLYNLKRYTEAEPYLAELSIQESDLGQKALYLLADSFLHQQKKEAAKPALYRASKMNYVPSIKDEALFNYAKLSAELQQYGDAVEAFQSIPEQSSFYTASQQLLSQVLLSTKDYDGALKIMDQMDGMTPELKEIHGTLQYQQAMELIKDDLSNKAIPFLKKSLKNSSDQGLISDAYYWLGTINAKQNNVNESMMRLGQYFASANYKNDRSLNAGLAHYHQGHNYISKNNYKKALSHFEQTIGFMQSSNQAYEAPIYQDALLRAGDLSLVENNYQKSLLYFNKSLDASKHKGQDYALYKKAIITGLIGQNLEKILLLENLGKVYPESEYKGPALLAAAEEYIKMGNSAKAYQHFSSVANGNNYANQIQNEALLRLGLISYNNNQNAKALQYYEKVTKNQALPEQLTQALQAIKEIYVDDQSDVDAYLEFIEDSPVAGNIDDLSRDSLSYIVGYQNFETGNYTEAISKFSTYLTNYENGFYKSNALFYKSESHSLLKQYDQALEPLKIILKDQSNPYYEKALKNAALISYNHSQNFAAAYSYYNKLTIILTDKNQQLEAHLGALYSAQKIGKIEVYDQHARVITTDSNATWVQKSFAQYCLGKSAMDKKMIDAALDYFRLVTQGEKNIYSAEAKYSMAEIYFEKNDLKLSEQLANNVTIEFANYHYWVAKSILLLSDIYLKNKDFLKSRAAVEAVIEHYEGNDDILDISQKKLERIKAIAASESRIKDPGAADTLEMIEGNE